MRLRGLYLAILTLGLVFIGIHLSRVFPQIAGDTEAGRRFPEFDIKLWREETPLVNVSSGDSVTGWFGLNTFEVSTEQKVYWFALVVLVVMTFLAKNIIRSRTGRAFQAIRDRNSSLLFPRYDLVMGRRNSKIAFSLPTKTRMIARGQLGSWLYGL